MVPVPKTDAVVARVSTKIDDDAHEEQSNEGDDLDAAEPELEFTEDAYAEEVYTENWRMQSKPASLVNEFVLTEYDEDN